MRQVFPAAILSTRDMDQMMKVICVAKGLGQIGFDGARPSRWVPLEMLKNLRLLIISCKSSECLQDQLKRGSREMIIQKRQKIDSQCPPGSNKAGISGCWTLGEKSK